MLTFTDFTVVINFVGLILADGFNWIDDIVLFVNPITITLLDFLLAFEVIELTYNFVLDVAYD